MYRETIIDNDDYTADLEYYDGHLFLHCDVHNITRDSYKRMVRDWMDMEEALYQHGAEKVYACPEKTGFVEDTGWEYVTSFTYLGKERGVYVWDLRRQ